MLLLPTTNSNTDAAMIRKYDTCTTVIIAMNAMNTDTDMKSN